MKKIEIKAATLEDAITEASLELGVTSDKLAYDVIEEGSNGFLGIGKKPTIIEAYIKCEEKVEEKIEKIKKKAEKKIEKIEKKADKRAEKKPEITPSVPKKKKEIVSVKEDNIKATEEYLLAILKEMGFDATVHSVEEEDHTLCMEVAGEDMGMIIGKRGQTLDTIQYLLNRAAGRRQEGNIRIKLDTEDYRSRRKKTLENLARNVASKAKKTRRNVVLEPMNPYERMIIHSTLQDDPAVTTYSKGHEPYRTVVVAIKKD